MAYTNIDILINRLNITKILDTSPSYVRDEIIGLVRELPKSDVVEVVRCRDCKHNEDNGGDYRTGKQTYQRGNSGRNYRREPSLQNGLASKK